MILKLFITITKKKGVLKLWLKMSDIEENLGHSNIADAVLKRMKKYCGKKTQSKTFFESEKDAFIVEKPAPDVIENCKLPEAIDLRKKLEYNHDNTMVCEKT